MMFNDERMWIGPHLLYRHRGGRGPGGPLGPTVGQVACSSGPSFISIQSSLVGPLVGQTD
jgi:hypothetical protein